VADMHTIDDLHRALGEFLTVCSRIENLMFGLIWVCDSKKRNLETVFKEFSALTFGPKIDQFKKAFSEYPFSELRRAELAAITLKLEDLLPKRNSLVHGETYEVGFNGELAVPYRIGVTKKDFDYLNKFVANKDSEHAFNVPRIQETCAQCREIHKQMGEITNELMNALVEASKRKSS
jgi:hypothetical protein